MVLDLAIQIGSFPLRDSEYVPPYSPLKLDLTIAMLVLTAVPIVVITYVIDSYQDCTSDAMTTLNIFRNCISASFIFFTLPMVERTGVKSVCHLYSGADGRCFAY